MKFPSIADAAQVAARTAARFPLAILSALVACGTVIAMIEGNSVNHEPRLFATAMLGLSLFAGAVVTAERHRIEGGRRLVVMLVLAAGLAGLYVVSTGWTDRLAVLRFVQLLLAAHLLVAVAPYLGVEERNGFWQFNRSLLLRHLTGAFYALVLWVGLSIALVAIRQLFGVHIDGKVFGELMAVLAFGFHPWFFLAGVPDDFDALDAREDYPTGLKVFSQFVLIPLVTVYLAILTAYLGKVLLTRTWPSGWIGYLVSSVSLVGVLAVLLIHPIRSRSDSKWVDAYGRWWFVVLLPSLGMLLLAIGKRIGQYGVTEPRYFLLVLAVWMLGIALFYGVTGSKDIRRIPESLFLVAALSAIGPWGAYGVSRRSQTGRLATTLAANGMGRPGDVHAPSGPVSRDDRYRIGAVLQYLNETHGPRSVARVLGVSEDSVKAWSERDAYRGAAINGLRHFGLAYSERVDGPSPVGNWWLNPKEKRTVDLRGFEAGRAVEYPILGWVVVPGDSLQLARAAASGVVAVIHGTDTLFTLDLRDAILAQIGADSLGDKQNLFLDVPIFAEDSGAGYRVRLVFEALSGRHSDSGLVVHFGTGYALASGFRRR